MKKRGLLFIVLLLALAVFYFYSKSPQTTTLTGNVISSSENSSNSNIKIANWNLQIFGDTKAAKPELMNLYASTITKYDLIFIQEIRDSDSSSFDSLCSMLSEYNCINSSRAGRSTSKEQYGIIYKKDISLIDFKDFNPDVSNRWERPPIEVTFSIANSTFRFYNMHTKPEDVPAELTALQQIVNSTGNTIILGDFNADCNYYNSEKETQFDSWHWIINDTEDTTVTQTNCAYDRIILNDNVFNNYVSYGIYRENITSQVSDHYLIWIELKQ